MYALERRPGVYLSLSVLVGNIALKHRKMLTPPFGAFFELFINGSYDTKLGEGFTRFGNCIIII